MLEFIGDGLEAIRMPRGLKKSCGSLLIEFNQNIL